jgi:hypothetical protein
MKVSKVYINTYKYDFAFTKICVASIRYWYPDIPIVIIKDVAGGNFNTGLMQKMWNVQVFETNRKNFGWGFGKWEPLFLNNQERFLVLDADTAITGPILDVVEQIDSHFIVDEEVQPEERFNEIYYKLDKINEVNPEFIYPGYSFNEGQWFGTSGILARNDFDSILVWTSPPTPKFPQIILQGAQGHLNYTLQWLVQNNKLTLTRKKIMLWPLDANANLIKLEKIRSRSREYPFIIHWAGIKFNQLNKVPYSEVASFYKEIYYQKSSYYHYIMDFFIDHYLFYQKRLRHGFNRFLSKLK